MAFQKLLIRLRSKTNQYLGWFPPTITRLSLGLLFTGTGWGKVHNLDHVTEYFTSLNIPFPAFNAYLVGFTELICGSLLILGLFTRFASIPLIISMIVALMTAKADEISTFNDLASLTEYLYIILLLWLVVQGPGPVSLDRIISKRLDQSS